VGQYYYTGLKSASEAKDQSAWALRYISLNKEDLFVTPDLAAADVSFPAQNPKRLTSFLVRLPIS
jgi:hypothetical protein